jgi:hypothetical protein
MKYLDETFWKMALGFLGIVLSAIVLIVFLNSLV